MPPGVTLANEFAPTRRRGVLTSAMFTGFPLGAALGGVISAWMIPHFGWRSVLVLGGLCPLLLAALMFFFLPESARHMVTRRVAAERIRAVLTKISATVGATEHFVLSENVAKAKPNDQTKSGIALVLSRSYLLA